MKTTSLILIGLSLLFVSCGENNNEEVEKKSAKNEVENQEPKESSIMSSLSKRWIHKKYISTDGKKEFSFGDGSSDVVLRLDNNGYFTIYDSITDTELIEKGVRKIEQRSSGQWELLSDDLFVLRNNSNDTISIDTLRIDSIKRDKLVTTTLNKNRITYFSID